MTKFEYHNLYDRLVYGHDADVNVDNHRFFIEWESNGIAVYRMQGKSGIAIALLQGENRTAIVNELFDFPFIDGKSLNNSYPDISILDIE